MRIPSYILSGAPTPMIYVLMYWAIGLGILGVFLLVLWGNFLDWLHKRKHKKTSDD